MKYTYALALGLLGLVMCGCGGHKGSDNATNSDSAQTATLESPAAGPTEYFLTADSIGPVKVGMPMASLPQAVPNLYDVVLTTETPDAMAFTYLLADVPQFTIYDFMEGKVDVIALEGNSRGVETPEGSLRVGDAFSRVLALPGVEAEWESLDDTGIWYWKWRGLYFGVDETGVTEDFGNALCDSKRPPRAALFTPDIKVGYIATGLPF